MIPFALNAGMTIGKTNSDTESMAELHRQQKKKNKKKKTERLLASVHCQFL